MRADCSPWASVVGTGGCDAQANESCSEPSRRSVELQYYAIRTRSSDGSLAQDVLPPSGHGRGDTQSRRLRISLNSRSRLRSSCLKLKQTEIRKR